MKTDKAKAEFDLGKWVNRQTNLLASCDRIHAYSCIKLGFLKCADLVEAWANKSGFELDDSNSIVVDAEDLLNFINKIRG